MKHCYFLSIITLFLISCNPDPTNPDPVVTYPISYSYKGIEYEKATFFVVSSTGLQEISAKGNFIAYEDGVKEVMVDFIAFDDNIKSVELLDDKNAKITLNDGISEVITYAKNGDLLSLTIDPDTKETIDLKTIAVTGSKTQVKIPFCCSLFSYKKNGQQDYSPFEINLCKNTNLQTIANDVLTKNKLKLNDTIAVNVVQAIYE